jgi:hypothetical protein
MDDQLDFPRNNPQAFLGQKLETAVMVTGRIGTPASSVTTNPPFLKGSSFPSLLLVPSGKKITEAPAPIFFPAALRFS